MNDHTLDVAPFNFGWYVVYTKPREETRAKENLVNQGFRCYLPMFESERIRRQKTVVMREPMFPRYLFVHLDDLRQNWLPIRSTLGVSKLVEFGGSPAQVPESLIATLKAVESDSAERPHGLFAPGERVRVRFGPFINLEGIYQVSDGRRRAMVLVELMSKMHLLTFEQAALAKV